MHCLEKVYRISQDDLCHDHLYCDNSHNHNHQHQQKHRTREEMVFRRDLMMHSCGINHHLCGDMWFGCEKKSEKKRPENVAL